MNELSREEYTILLDKFAMAALAHLRCGDWSTCEDAARYCFDHAEAMLKEREKRLK
jgi:hypothetical protein